MADNSPRTWIATLRRSHDNLVGLVQPMTPEQVRAQSYCSDWTNAQVLSHLGSGAKIALLMLPGALGEGEPADRAEFPKVWDVWNAKSPDDQAADALTSDEEHVQRLEQLSDDQLAAARLDFFGTQLDGAGIVRLRLGEHVAHTWDLAVMTDPGATLPADAVELMIDQVADFFAPRLGKPAAEPFKVRITTTGPQRDYLLSAGEQVSMVNWPGEAGAGADVPQVVLPAEALMRLATGRLDPAHTPAQVSGDPVVLDKLRAVFPGF